MSNMIGFLAAMGQDASLRNATPNQLVQALERGSIDLESQHAILGRNQAQIESLLDSKTNVCCVLFPVVPEKEKDDESEESPSRDDDEIAARFVIGEKVKAA